MVFGERVRFQHVGTMKVGSPVTTNHGPQLDRYCGDIDLHHIIAKMKEAGLAARSTAFQQAHTGQPMRVFLYERDRYIYNDLARRTGSVVFSASRAEDSEWLLHP